MNLGSNFMERLGVDIALPAFTALRFILLKSVFLILLLSLSACSSGQLTATPQSATGLHQAAAASEEKKPRLRINQSVNIFTYAAASRDRCMSLFNDTGNLLRKISDGSHDSLRQGLIENRGNIHAQLLQISEQLQINADQVVSRPTQSLKSDDVFMTNMEQAIAACDNSLRYLIDKITTDVSTIPAEGELLPAEDVAERYNAVMYPQLKALELIYTFEAAEYADYDTWLSAQYQFVLMMQQLYQELQIIADAYINNSALPDREHFKTALTVFFALKANAKKEVTMLSGMELLMKLSNTNIPKSALANEKKKVSLQADFDAVVADFEPNYITILTELSKSEPDEDVVLESLNLLLVSVVGNEQARTGFRKHYMQNLLRVLEIAAKQKKQS
jgi:hypothetical protein